jgi:plastocyanin
METTPKPPEAPKAKSKTMTLVAIVIVILIVVGVAAYYLTQNTSTATVSVHLQDNGACALNEPKCLFTPASYNATVNGAAVVWKNDGTVGHTVAANSTQNGSLPTFSSPTIGAGGTYSFTFATAGTYHYFCTIHTWMKGTVTAK